MSHRWPDEHKVVVDHTTTRRTCPKCGLVKITRHEPDNDPPHWTEWERDGRKFKSILTPPCEEAMKADAPKEYRLVELRADNFMKLKAVRVSIDGSVLKINGRNEQGKSAVLNAVAAAIGGPKAFPEKPVRKGQDKAEIFLDFGGLKLTRKIWNKDDGGGVEHSIVLEYADGKRPKDKQSVLNELRGSPIADDPIAFSKLPPAKRYELLKQLVPGFDFEDHEQKRQDMFEERTATGRLRDRAQGAADAIQVPADAPLNLVGVQELLAELAAATEHNTTVDKRAARREEAAEQLEEMRDQYDKMKRELEKLSAAIAEADRMLETAAPLPEKIDVAELQAKMANAETLNAGARKRAEKLQRQAEADKLVHEYEEATKAIQAMDDLKAAAIEKAKLPIPELSFGHNDILIDGLPFDQASTARKIRVSTALLMALKPDLRVLLVREGSLLDNEAKAALEADAKSNNFVVLMECVGAGDGSGIVIEDGEVV